jgi:hypothetical protein
MRGLEWKDLIPHVVSVLSVVFMGGRYHQKYYMCEMNGHKQKWFIINPNDSLCLEMIEHNVVTWLDKMWSCETIHLNLKWFTSQCSNSISAVLIHVDNVTWLNVFCNDLTSHEQMIHAILKPFTVLWNDSTKCETIQQNVNWFNLMWIDSI